MANVTIDVGEPDVLVENGDLVGDDQCTICMECLNNNLKTLPCSHEFHQPCINKWLANKNICPICRRVIPVAQAFINQNISRNIPRHTSPRRPSPRPQRNVSGAERLPVPVVWYYILHLLYLIPITMIIWALNTEYHDDPHVCANGEEYPCVNYNAYLWIYLIYCGICFLLGMCARKEENQTAMFTFLAATYIMIIAGFAVAFSKQLGAKSRCGDEGGRTYPTCKDTLYNNPVYFYAVLSTTFPTLPIVVVGALMCLGNCFWRCCIPRRRN